MSGTRLIIGDAVTEFKKSYEGSICFVSNNEELRSLVAYYSGIRTLDREIVIEDISFIPDASSTLLKFIEDTTLDVILLSRYDKVDQVLLSRISDVDKRYTSDVTSQFLNCSVGNEKIEDMLSSDTSYYDKARYYANIAPKMIMLDKTVKVASVKKKIYDFVR